MNGGPRIIDLHAGRQAPPEATLSAVDSDDGVTTLPYEAQEYYPDEYVAPRAFGWVWPTLGVVASLAWIGGMVWLALPTIQAGMRPVALAQFVAALCVPPALIGVLLLLGLRTSRAEASRFGASARAMRAEAAQLEATVGALSARLADNRAALAEQAQLLSSMGDHASVHMAELGGIIASETQTLRGTCDALTRAAGDVQSRLGIIFETLPKAHAETTAIADRLTATGLSASEHAALLEAQLSGLAERGRLADEMAGGAAARLAAHIERMEATSESAAAKLEATSAEMSSAIDVVLDRAAQAVDEARKGIAAQGDAMLAMLGTSQVALDKAGRDGADALASRLTAVEDTIARIGARLGEEQARSEALFDTLGVGIDSVGHQFSRVHATGSQQSQELAAAISALDGSAAAMTETMLIGESTARQLIGTAEELLTALDASAREIDETLPEALARLDARIAQSRKTVGAAKPELLALVTAAESTHDAVEAVHGLVMSEREKLAQITASLTEALDTGQDKALTMEAVVNEAIARARSFATDAAPQLVDALQRIRESAVHAADSARDVLTGVIPDAAAQIEEASAEAVRRAFDQALPHPLAELNQASELAVRAATRASEQLAQQLMTIAETTTIVEARIDAERSTREAANQDNFARRVSLLIEALNSASIDITKTFSHEVTDSAWAAYLKGDRGVFTRRAVRLLDSSEAREVARLHELDPAFRENVNRYIHDFEAMLRQILALRDGSPLGVTLLSSDMGKLYVALAQAIERLRT